MFSKKTVDSVIGGLSTMITDLEEVHAQQDEEQERQGRIVTDATIKMLTAGTDSAIAVSVATKT